jgi:hypothetical protein
MSDNINNNNILSIFDKIQDSFGKKLLFEAANKVEFISTKNTSGITVQGILISKDIKKNKDGFTAKIDVFIPSLKNCIIGEDIGERISSEEINLLVKLQVKLNQEEKSSGKFGKKQYKYVTVLDEESNKNRTYTIKGGNSVKLGIYCGGVDDNNYKQINNNPLLSLITLQGLRPVLGKEYIDKKTGEKKNYFNLNVSDVKVKPPIYPFHIINDSVPRFGSIVPKLETKKPSNDELEKYNKIENKEIKINSLWAKNMTPEELSYYFSEHWIRLFPSTKEEKLRQREEIGQMQLPTTYNSYIFKKEQDNSTMILTNLISSCYSWGKNGKSLSENELDGFGFSATFFSDHVGKIFGTSDPLKWEILAPIHAKKIKSIFLGWVDKDESYQQNLAIDEQHDKHKFIVKIVPKILISNLFEYLIINEAGYEVSKDYSINKLQQELSDILVGAESIDYGGYYKDKKLSEKKISEIQGIETYISSTQCGLINLFEKNDNLNFLRHHRDFGDSVYISLNNFVLTNEQKDIYNAWTRDEKVKRMSQIFSGKGSKYLKELGIKKLPNNFTEIIFLTGSKAIDDFKEYYEDHTKSNPIIPPSDYECNNYSHNSLINNDNNSSHTLQNGTVTNIDKNQSNNDNNLQENTYIKENLELEETDDIFEGNDEKEEEEEQQIDIQEKEKEKEKENEEEQQQQIDIEMDDEKEEREIDGNDVFDIMENMNEEEEEEMEKKRNKEKKSKREDSKNSKSSKKKSSTSLGKRKGLDNNTDKVHSRKKSRKSRNNY